MPVAASATCSDAGEPDYACYVIVGTAKPHAAGMKVFELASFEDAYLAQRALALAYSALVKLDVPSLDIALKQRHTTVAASRHRITSASSISSAARAARISPAKASASPMCVR